jgi:hypothetical protein
MKHRELSEILGCDRATIYHAIKKTSNALEIGYVEFVEGIKRWMPIIDEYIEDFNRVSTDRRGGTTEDIIFNLLSIYDVEKSVSILDNVTKKICERQEILLQE